MSSKLWILELDDPDVQKSSYSYSKPTPIAIPPNEHSFRLDARNIQIKFGPREVQNHEVLQSVWQLTTHEKLCVPGGQVPYVHTEHQRVRSIEI